MVTVAADSELQIDYEHYYSEEDENNSLSEIESIEYDDEEERDDNSSGFMDELESSQYNLF